MVSARGGRTSLGCLMLLALIGVGAYVGSYVGELYWREYQFRDAMRQQIRFASQMSDQTIQANLATFADSLGLPDDASDNLSIDRSRDGTMTITSEYDEQVQLPIFKRTFHLKPRAEGSF